ncbi:DUF3137 domain-containing protein [Myceligenerans crystallogenes]|uniref:Uncharacterized protein n=1 Tax=Myceligenerans crystallogenes TaxID=316335 RepID=A0ABN2NE56_9MICO
MEPLVLFLGVAAALGLAYLVTRPLRERRRVKDITEWADMNGWERAEAATDAQLPYRWPGGPFLEQRKEPATDVMYGNVSGHRMISFTHTWRTGKEGSRFSRKRYAHVIALDEDAAEPRLELTPEGWRDKIQKVFGGQDVQLGNPAFDDAWRVRASDDVFARRVLDPRFMSMLMLPDYQKTNIRVDGPAVMLWTDGKTNVENLSKKSGKLVEVARLTVPLEKGQPVFESGGDLNLPGMGFEKI